MVLLLNKVLSSRAVLLFATVPLCVWATLFVTEKWRGSRWVCSPLVANVNGTARRAAAPHSRERASADQGDGSALFLQIDRDLAAFGGTGITLAMVEKVYCSSWDESWRLQIIDNKAYTVGEITGNGGRNRALMLQILEVLSLYRIPDVDLVFITADGPQPPPSRELPCWDGWGPVLTFCKKAEQTYAVLVPDNTFGDNPEILVPGWRHAQAMMQQALQEHPWEARIEQLFFAGFPNGASRSYLFQNNELRNSSMLRVVENDSFNFRDEGEGEREKAVSLSDHCAYKYLLHMEGNTFASRFKWLLLCESAVVFPRSEWYEFWYPLLRDGENVVVVDPINATNMGAHLVDVIESLRADDERARAVAAGGARLAYDALSVGNVLRYWQLLLTKYAALQKFTPQLHPDAVPMPRSISVVPTIIEFSDRTCDAACPVATDEDRIHSGG